MTGLRRIFGDWKLPNLSKVVPIEPILRKTVNEVAQVVRNTVGDPLRPVTRSITDPLTNVLNSAGGTAPGQKSDAQIDAEKKLGPSTDRTSTDSKVTKTDVDNSVKVNTTAPATSTAPTKSTTNDTGIPNNTLASIRDGNSLLFWAMMVGNNIPYSSYVRNNDNFYYAPEKKQNTLNKLNQIASNPNIKRLYPLIPTFLDAAITKLEQKTQNAMEEKTTSANSKNKKIILASLNKICNELEEINCHKEVYEITNIMKKIVAREEKD